MIRSIELDQGELSERLELGGQSVQEEMVVAQGTES